MNDYEAAEALLSELEIREAWPPAPTPPVDFLARAGVFSAVDLMGRSFPPVVYLVEGMIAEGLTILAGSPKVGKSWLVLALASSIAGGTAALGTVPTGQRRPVLYLALEDGPRRLQDRLRHLGVARPPVGLTFATTVAPADLMPTIRAWITLHRGLQPVVVVDTLGRVLRPARAGESDYLRDYDVMTKLKELADVEPGSGIVLVHHTRKLESSDFLDAVSGTQGIAGGADAVVVLRRRRNEDLGSIAVTSRDAREGEYAVRFEDGTWTLVGSTLEEAARAHDGAQTTSGLGDRSADIVGFVTASPVPLSVGDVFAVFGEQLGMSRDDVGKYLRRAAEAERIAKIGRGRYWGVRSVRVSAMGEENGQADTTDAPMAVPTEEDR